MGEQRSLLPIRVLGVDPGSVRTGWGVVEQQGRTIRFCAGGVLTAHGFRTLPERLRVIYNGLSDIIRTWRPQVLSVEKAFLAYNVQSAFRLGEARGVVLLAGAQAGVRLVEYSPAEIKTAVVGYGRAEKHQVQQAVLALLGGEAKLGAGEVPVSQDATDALAAAICHLHTVRFAARVQEVER